MLVFSGFALGALVAVAPQGRADVLHDTTAGATTSNWLVGFSEGDPNDPMHNDTINQPADSFVVSGGDFTLDTLTLNLRATTGPPGALADDYVIRLWDNDVNKPGTLLESFTILDSENLLGDTTVASVLGTPLLDGQKYWVSAALPDDLSDGAWRSVDIPSLGRATAFSNSASASWSPRSSAADAFYLKVEGTLVPEPAAAGLALLGAGAVLRRRRVL